MKNISLSESSDGENFSVIVDECSYEEVFDVLKSCIKEDLISKKGSSSYLVYDDEHSQPVFVIDLQSYNPIENLK